VLINAAFLQPALHAQLSQMLRRRILLAAKVRGNLLTPHWLMLLHVGQDGEFFVAESVGFHLLPLARMAPAIPPPV
jgi:hypothetical protein